MFQRMEWKTDNVYDQRQTIFIKSNDRNIGLELKIVYNISAVELQKSFRTLQI